MEKIMIILEFMFKSIGHFLGCLVLIGGFANWSFLMWNRLLRSFTLRKHGYPPPHCDADGDGVTTEED